MKKRYAKVDQKRCAACGECVYVCPRAAVSISNGCYAKIDSANCIGCGLCAKNCPANSINIIIEGEKHETETLV